MRYRKLPGHRRGLIHTASLWLGADHLLSVKSVRVREEYKRFHLRDIQAIVIADGPRFHISTWALGVGALWLVLFLAAGTLSIWARPALELLGVAIVAAWAYVSAACSCRCRIFTAVSSEDLPSIYRTWTARRFLAVVEPRIAEAQGPMPGEWAEALEQRRIGPPDLVIPRFGAPPAGSRQPARRHTPASDLFLLTLFADAAVTALTLRDTGPAAQWAMYLLAALKAITAVFVLMQYHRGALVPALQKIAIAALVVMGLLYYLRPVFAGLQASTHPNSIPITRDTLGLLEFPSILRQIDIAASVLLGIAGVFVALRPSGAPESV